MKWLPLATSAKITCAKNEAAPVTALWIRVIAAAIADFLLTSSRPAGAEQKYVGIFASRSPSGFWPRAYRRADHNGVFPARIFADGLPARQRLRLGSDGIRTEPLNFVLTHFLCANRYPLRSKTLYAALAGGSASTE